MKYPVIAEHIAKVGFTGDLTPDSYLADLDLDSFDTVELIMNLEGYYSVYIEDAEMGNIKTVEDIAAILRKKGVKEEKL